MENQHAIDVKRLRAGDADEFRRLVRIYGPTVRAWLSGHLRDRAQVADLTQETFIAAWEALSRYRHDGKLGPWLIGIAHNRLKMHYRSSARRSAAMASYENQLSTLLKPQPPTRLSRRLATLEDCLPQLPERSRAVLEARYADGSTRNQLASDFGMQPNTVKQLLYRVKQQLRDCIERENGW